MFFDRKQPAQRSSNKPTEVARVSPNLSIALWKGSNDRMHFKIERAGEGGQTYSTLKPEHILEMPAALSVIAIAFSKAPGLSGELRDELRRMAMLLERVAVETSENGLDPDPHAGSVSLLGKGL